MIVQRSSVDSRRGIGTLPEREKDALSCRVLVWRSYGRSFAG